MKSVAMLVVACAAVTTATAQPAKRGPSANFQTLSMAQKATKASGGYTEPNFTPGVQVSTAITYADAAIGKIVAELKAKNSFTSIVVIIIAKHGQLPSDHSKLVRNGDTLMALMQANGYLNAIGNWRQNATASSNPNDGTGLVGMGVIQTDDLGLI